MSGNAERVAKRLKVFGFTTVGVIVLVTWLILETPGGDDSAVVPAPSAEMRAQTAAILAQASAAQGICYGWHLISEGRTVSHGSSLGPDTAVDSDPDRCPRWMQVEARVVYTSPSSEISDWATSRIITSGLTTPAPIRLEEFGFTDSVFIDEPDRAICQAALVLPLLVVENGDAQPVPTPSATDTPPAAVPAALPDAGSDFWRDRWAHVLGAAFLLLVAALVVTIGWFERQHQRRPPALSGRAGTARKSQASAVGKK